LWHTAAVKRILGFLAFVVVLGALAAAALAFVVQRSLAPDRESRTIGAADAAGVTGTVTIELNRAGVPTIRGEDEAAVAFGQGYAHARDRRFQMELFRRTAAGRLAELVGAFALPSDRFFRTLGFAQAADSGVRLFDERRRALFEAYAAGVNAYDRAHSAPPEFLLLGAPVEPWRPRDTALVALLMQQDQNFDGAEDEQKREVMEAALPPALVDFLLPVTTRGDVTIVEGVMPAQAPTPDAATVDLRTRQAVLPARFRTNDDDRAARGSNAWVIAGSRTASGRPLLANDPHMALRVPTTWHRQRLEWGGVAVTGATLPGVPGVAIGTNGAVAWSMTNPQGDFVDLVRCVPADPETTTYHGFAGPEPFGTRIEVIRVKGGGGDTLRVRTTRFGPVMGPSHAPGGGLLAVQWSALDPRSSDTDLMDMNRATSVAALFAALDGYRGPQVSVLAADSTGHIGWKLGGVVPDRGGARFDRPREATDPAAAWRGWIAGDTVPSLVDPAAGFLVTCNQRVVGGAGWERLGGRVGAPWRAQRIAALLAAADSSRADASAMAALQNDLDNGYLEPTALAIERAIAAGTPDDTLSRVAALLRGREHRADSTSVAHAYLVTTRFALNAMLIDPLVAPCLAVDSSFTYDDALVDEVVARLLEERPPHLLDPRYPDYDALVRAAARAGAARLGARVPGTPFDRIPWGAINRADVVHPLGAASPVLARLLDMPKAGLAGGSHVVRVARPRHGASMRLVADLGDRAAGRFALPGGQSGHFRSPHYGDGFAGWWRGETGPLEPGPRATTIVLRPAP
jgi:penicillin amidase